MCLPSTWVVRKELHRFENELGEGYTKSTDNPLHAQGWRQAIRLYALTNPLPELKKAVHQQRLERGHPKAPTGIDEIANIKRKGTPLSKYSRIVEESDDEEPEAWSVRQQSSTGDKIKKEPGESGIFTNMNVGEASTDLTTSNSEQPQKKSRLDTLGRSSTRPSTPLRAATQGLSSTHMAMDRATPALALKVMIDE